jgi:signal transduction histidine kinase
MVKSFLDKIAARTRIGFFAAFFLLLLSYILTYISTRAVINQDFWMNHTNEVIHDLDNISNFISKGVSAFRGYVITDDKGFLDIYRQSVKNTDSTLARLKNLTADDALQKKNLDSLSRLVSDKQLWISGLISRYESEHKVSDELLEGSRLDVLQSSEIENQIFEMKQEETNLWNQRYGKVSEYSDLLQIFNIFSIIIAVLLAFYSIVVYNKEYKARRLASKKAEEYKEQLQRRVKQLGDLNTELIELRRLEKYTVTGRIARVIAHEVRNPLTNINLATAQLRSELGNSDSIGMLFNMINRNSERINQLVSDLLNTTRVAELTFTKASLNDLLDQSLELATDRIELNQIEVIKEYDPNLCPVSVDVSKVKIAFLNIIVNAIEAMGEHGVLKITTLKDGNHCVIKISDNGKGMTKAEMDRLFEPYFTTKGKGNGLGLANSQNIILGHKGNISAESEPAKGTTFTMIFNDDESESES